MYANILVAVDGSEASKYAGDPGCPIDVSRVADKGNVDWRLNVVQGGVLTVQIRHLPQSTAGLIHINRSLGASRTLNGLPPRTRPPDNRAMYMQFIWTRLERHHGN